MSLKKDGKAIWPITLVVLGVFALLVVAVLLVKLPQAPQAAKPQQISPMEFIRLEAGKGNLAVQEQAQLFDPTPLFLPTPFNASQPHLEDSRLRESGTSFQQSLPAKLVHNAYSLSLSFSEPAPTPTRPIDAMEVGQSQNPFFSFGQLDPQGNPLSTRLAYLEVSQIKDGRLVLAADLAFLSGNFPKNAEWRPLQLMVAVDAAGLVGEPVVTEGSGVEEVDSYFRNFLAKTFRLGERLHPGIYTLRIGP